MKQLTCSDVLNLELPEMCTLSLQKRCNSRFRVNQTFLSLTKFIEYSVNIYISKWISYYANIFDSYSEL